jgi:hypothetical protein
VIKETSFCLAEKDRLFFAWESLIFTIIWAISSAAYAFKNAAVSPN